MAKKTLRWGAQATDYLGEVVEDFKRNLRSSTLRAATQDNADSVDEKHVRQAHDFLIRVGLERTPFWRRPQVKFTTAGFLWGVMFAIPDFTPVFFESHDRQQAVVIGALVIFGFAGIALWLWGLTQNSL